MLAAIFSCCIRRQSSAPNHQIPNETSHLIPQSVDTSPPISPHLVVVDQERLKERLGDIIRSKEGKMVNVNASIPFNLHNQRLPSSRMYHRLGRPSSASASASVSRSASASTSRNENTYNNYGSTTVTSSTRPSALVISGHPHPHHHSTLALETSRSSSQCSSRMEDEYGDEVRRDDSAGEAGEGGGTATGQILNVRLVSGGEDGIGEMRRGRSRGKRGKQRDDGGDAGIGVSGDEGDEIAVEVHSPTTDEEEEEEKAGSLTAMRRVPDWGAQSTPTLRSHAPNGTSSSSHHALRLSLRDKDSVPTGNDDDDVPGTPSVLTPTQATAIGSVNAFQIKDTGMLVMGWDD